ncbi:MAG TPA: fumarylacetoacetase [Pirellulaceae bacterium]|nr:fumarylacetoacetase [Pirellulaceae bacterium]HMO93414.1 fumarylacetoacetase [Pirellulaceae bacterium]HMP70462.1 fumarylacetoacetase [Pirellulaceae bacterium]
MRPIDETHAPSLQSWVEKANSSDTEFPIQNLPFCRFRLVGQKAELGIAIGDQILRLHECARLKLIDARWNAAANADDLRAFMLLPVADRVAFRREISGLLRSDSKTQATTGALVAQDQVELLVPTEIGDYTDFYASIFHATNVGCMFRPTNPLLPNYKHIPIGYHGRASSIIASGQSVKRPAGQLPPAEENGAPSFGKCKNLDYELEVGAFVAQGNQLGEPIPLSVAEDFLFGLCLVNDWSARDMQRWEYQPLGPFLAKSFATSVSPFVVTMEALAPFRCASFQRAAGDPQPLEYLRSNEDRTSGGIIMDLQVSLSSETMRNEGIEPVQLSMTNFRQMYWTLAQMLTHHASNGCNLRAGDLIASGTVSGPERSARGCMLELTWDGDTNNPLPGSSRTPIKLPTGEERIFLQDGDEVRFQARCAAEGYRTIGFGPLVAAILP